TRGIAEGLNVEMALPDRKLIKRCQAIINRNRVTKVAKHYRFGVASRLAAVHFRSTEGGPFRAAVAERDVFGRFRQLIISVEFDFLPCSECGQRALRVRFVLTLNQPRATHAQRPLPRKRLERTLAAATKTPDRRAPLPPREQPSAVGADPDRRD